MTHEILYTSAPRGVQAGSRGFCTVVTTQGIPRLLAERLEDMSGYREVIPAHDPNADQNPVAHSHTNLRVGGRAYSVLSRICFAGLDYTNRSNKLAHHIVLESNEQSNAGPACLLNQPGFLETNWDGEPKTLPAGRQVPRASESAKLCKVWKKVTGDPGWAGVLAQSARDTSRRNVYLICELETDALSLIREAVALLDPGERWQATFTTYYTKLPPDAECQWRCVLKGSPEAEKAFKSDSLVLDLTRPLGNAATTDLTTLARVGESKPIAPPPARPQPGQSDEAPTSVTSAEPPPEPARQEREPNPPSATDDEPIAVEDPTPLHVAMEAIDVPPVQESPSKPEPKLATKSKLDPKLMIGGAFFVATILIAVIVAAIVLQATGETNQRNKERSDKNEIWQQILTAQERAAKAAKEVEKIATDANLSEGKVKAVFDEASKVFEDTMSQINEAKRLDTSKFISQINTIQTGYESFRDDAMAALTKANEARDLAKDIAARAQITQSNVTSLNRDVATQSRLARQASDKAGEHITAINQAVEKTGNIFPSHAPPLEEFDKITEQDLQNAFAEIDRLAKLIDSEQLKAKSAASATARESDIRSNLKSFNDQLKQLNTHQQKFNSQTQIVNEQTTEAKNQFARDDKGRKDTENRIKQTKAFLDGLKVDTALGQYPFMDLTLDGEGPKNLCQTAQLPLDCKIAKFEWIKHEGVATVEPIETDQGHLEWNFKRSGTVYAKFTRQKQHLVFEWTTKEKALREFALYSKIRLVVNVPKYKEEEETLERTYQLFRPLALMPIDVSPILQKGEHKIEVEPDGINAKGRRNDYQYKFLSKGDKPPRFLPDITPNPPKFDSPNLNLKTSYPGFSTKTLVEQPDQKAKVTVEIIADRKKHVDDMIKSIDAARAAKQNGTDEQKKLLNDWRGKVNRLRSLQTKFETQLRDWKQTRVFITRRVYIDLDDKELPILLAYSVDPPEPKEKAETTADPESEK